jgi:hypothetical protein
MAIGIEATQITQSSRGNCTNDASGSTVRFSGAGSNRLSFTNGAYYRGYAGVWHYQTGTVDQTGTTVNFASLTHPYGTLVFTDIMAVILKNTLSVTRVTGATADYSNGAATVTVTKTAHGLNTGQLVCVEKLNASDANHKKMVGGPFQITKDDADTFHYTSGSANFGADGDDVSLTYYNAQTLVWTTASVSTPFYGPFFVDATDPAGKYMTVTLGPGEELVLACPSPRGWGINLSTAQNNFKLKSGGAYASNTCTYQLWVLGVGTVS